MTNDNRTSDEIERDIADERAQMSDTINDLQKKFSVTSIVDELGTMVRTQGGDLGRAISHTVGRNPAAVALVGVGLAWLFLGPNRSRAAQSADDSQSDDAFSQSDRDTWGEDGASSGRRAATEAGDRDQYWYGDEQLARVRKTRGRAGDGRNRSKSGDAAQGGVGTMQNAASAAGDAVSGAAGSVSEAASDLTARLSHGLEDLSEDARARVVAARRAALDALLASQAAMKKGAQAASNFFADQPLVVGALAVALGAAMGGVLPGSKLEDDTLGASRDRLFADAQKLFREERDKAMAAVRGAASDVKDELEDVGSDLAALVPDGKNVGQVIVDRATDAAQRVYGRATGDAGNAGDERYRA